MTGITDCAGAIKAEALKQTERQQSETHALFIFNCG
jgi:hypothetical protein